MTLQSISGEINHFHDGDDLLDVPVLTTKLFYLLGLSVLDGLAQRKMVNAKPVKCDSRWIHGDVNFSKAVCSHFTMTFESNSCRFLETHISMSVSGCS